MIRINNIPLEIAQFPDGTFKINLVQEIGNDRLVVIDWQYENEVELTILMYVVEHLKNISVGNTYVLNLFYLPNARMDRIHHRSEVFTLKSFCNIINTLNFSQVNILDPHSNVSSALLNNVNVLLPTDFINGAISDIKHRNDISDDNFDDIVLFFPDNGAMKRYADLIPDYKYLYGNKLRCWETGEITGLEVVNPFNIDIKGKNILIIDDICSKGTTFWKSAEELSKYKPASISLYVTHCENTITEGHIFDTDLIDRVYSTNSIAHSEEFVALNQADKYLEANIVLYNYE